MAYVKNWLHRVWGTKYRSHFLSDEILKNMIGHIRSNAKDKNIQIELLDGHKGHIHFLIRLKPDQPLSKVIQLIKGESSHRLTITGHRPPVFNLKKIEDLLVTLYFYLLNHE